MDEDMFLSRLVAVGQVNTGNSPPPDTVWAAEGIQREVALDTGELISSSSSVVKAGQPGSSSSSSNSNMVKTGQSDSSNSSSNMAKAGQVDNNNNNNNSKG